MKCFNCSSETGNILYGVAICKSCVTDLRLFTDDTIARQDAEYRPSEKYNSLKAEVIDRLVIMEKDYLKKRLKLLHMLDRL